MSKVYRVEVELRATAYVRADSEEAALARLRGFDKDSLEIGRRDQQIGEDLWISGRQYDDPALPEVSLSPAMTFIVPGDVEAEDANE
jgi:hypothetical protein